MDMIATESLSRHKAQKIISLTRDREREREGEKQTNRQRSVCVVCERVPVSFFQRSCALVLCSMLWQRWTWWARQIAAGTDSCTHSRAHSPALLVSRLVGAIVHTSKENKECWNGKCIWAQSPRRTSTQASTNTGTATDTRTGTDPTPTKHKTQTQQRQRSS